jgi:NodT family efflux transporter outer membrane factor (OMF) lipoprotein
MNPRLLAAGALACAPICTLLGGCAVGPDYRTPAVAAPSSFATPGEFDSTAPLLHWWQVLGDDNLTALIERAIDGANLDLRAAAARIRQARAELGVAGAAAEPSVNASAQVSRDRFSRNSELFANLPFPNPQVQFTDYRAGFDASWELDLFGHISRSVEGADARLQSVQAGWRDTRISVAGELARTYVQLRQSEQQLALAEADLAAIKQSADLVQLRWEAGNTSELDLRRARADVQTQSAAVDGIRAEAAASLNALAVLVGATPEEARKLVQPGRPVPAVAAGRVAVGLPSELLRRRPDVRRAERDLAAASADIGVATADLYPRFELVGNFGVDTIQPGELGKLASRTWSLAPQFYLPVFGRGRLTSEVAAREAARDAALTAYQKSVLAALSDVETALVRFDRARARLAALEQAWRDLEASAALARTQRAAGRSSSIDVLQAEHQARQSQQQVTDASAALAIQLVALYKALGGGWDDADPGTSAAGRPTLPTSMSARERP